MYIRSFDKEETKHFDSINEAVNELVKIRIEDFEKRAEEVERKFEETRNLKRIITDLRRDLRKFQVYKELINKLEKDGVIKWSYDLDWGDWEWYIYGDEEYVLGY